MIKKILNILRYLYALPIIVGLGNNALADKNISASEIKAEIILQFPYITIWPDNIAKKEINICVLGKDEIGSFLPKIINEQNDEKIKFFHLKSMQNIKNCNLLYITEEYTEYAIKILHITKELPLLTFSPIKDFVIMGGDVGFKSSKKKIGNFSNENIKFNINLNHSRSTGISFDPLILELADSVMD